MKGKCRYCGKDFGEHGDSAWYYCNSDCERKSKGNLTREEEMELKLLIMEQECAQLREENEKLKEELKKDSQ